MYMFKIYIFLQKDCLYVKRECSSYYNANIALEIHINEYTARRCALHGNVKRKRNSRLKKIYSLELKIEKKKTHSDQQ